MTLSELENMDRAVITPEVAASVLGCNAQVLRIQARTRPEALGFPVVCLGCRVKIPRLPFIKYLRDGVVA